MKIYRSNTKRGQAVLEYAILLIALAAVFYVMGLYAQRAAQAKFRVVQDRINEAVR